MFSHMEKWEGYFKERNGGQGDKGLGEIEHGEQGRQPHKPAAAILNPH